MTSGIIEILIENAQVQSLVGTDDEGLYKIYPTIAPQGVAHPYITVSEVTLNPSLSKGCPSTLDRPRYNVLVHTLGFRQGEVLQEACRVALDTGTSWSTETVFFNSVYMVDRQDLWMPATGQDKGFYVKLGVYEAESRRSIT